MSQPDIKYSIKVPGPAGADSEKGVGPEHSGWAEAARIDLIRRDYEERIAGLNRRSTVSALIIIVLLGVIVVGVFIFFSKIEDIKRTAYNDGLHNGAPTIAQLEIMLETYTDSYESVQEKFYELQTSVANQRKELNVLSARSPDTFDYSIDVSNLKQSAEILDAQIKEAEAEYQRQLEALRIAEQEKQAALKAIEASKREEAEAAVEAWVEAVEAAKDLAPIPEDEPPTEIELQAVESAVPPDPSEMEVVP